MGDRRLMALGVLCLLLGGVVVYDRLPRRTEAVSQPIAKPNPPEFVTKLVLMPEEDVYKRQDWTRHLGEFGNRLGVDKQARQASRP